MLVICDVSSGHCAAIHVPILQKIGELAATFVSFQFNMLGDLIMSLLIFVQNRASTLEGTDSSLDVRPVFLVSSLLDDCNWMLIS